MFKLLGLGSEFSLLQDKKGSQLNLATWFLAHELEACILNIIGRKKLTQLVLEEALVEIYHPL